jgi:ElaB/YqjD/DUF883 family membrane-anchored ribosome-binding protein
MAHNDGYHRSPEEIEHEIEQERSALSHTLEDLQSRLSFDYLFGGVAESLKEHSGDIGHSAVQKVKENPMAIALAGIGIAWMMMGSKGTPSSATMHRLKDRFSRDHDDDMPRAAYDRTHSPSATGLRDPQEHDMGDFTRRVAKADSEMRTSGSGSVGATGGSGSYSPTYGRASAAAAGGSRSRYSASSYASRSAGHSGELNEFPDEPGVWTRRTQNLKGKAQSLLSRMSEGTEGMSEQARERVLRARARAYEAQRSAEDYARRGKSTAIDFYDRQPLVAGALALATGALIGSLLPRSTYEDRAFGEQSDHLFDEAQRVFEEERSKLTKVAEAAGNKAKAEAQSRFEEAKSAVRDAKDAAPDAKDAASAAQDKAKSSAQRVADAAKEEADKQKLGKL